MAKDEDKRESDDSVKDGSVKNVNSDYNERMTQDNHPDPSAKRNVGLNGALERSNQKDQLENLEIRGNETTGYGANKSNSIEEFAQGPGFEYEGSDTAMNGSTNGIRITDQPLDTEDENENKQ